MTGCNAIVKPLENPNSASMIMIAARYPGSCNDSRLRKQMKNIASAGTALRYDDHIYSRFLVSLLPNRGVSAIDASIPTRKGAPRYIIHNPSLPLPITHLQKYIPAVSSSVLVHPSTADMNTLRNGVLLFIVLKAPLTSVWLVSTACTRSRTKGNSTLNSIIPTTTHIRVVKR